MLTPELKVGASTANGLQRRSILADVIKLCRLLDEHSLQSPQAELPQAYVCVLDNHHRKTFEIEALQSEVSSGDYHPGVCLITATASTRPSAPVGGALVDVEGVDQLNDQTLMGRGRR